MDLKNRSALWIFSLTRLCNRPPAQRGVTAAGYAQGANIAVIDPEVLDVFPDSAAVNRTLRALAPVLRLHIRPASKRKNT